MAARSINSLPITFPKKLEIFGEVIKSFFSFFFCILLGGDKSLNLLSNYAKKKNIHIKSGKSKEDFVKLRDERDAKLAMPKLIVPSLQINMRAGNMPEPDEQGDVFLKVPINKM